MGGMCYVCGDEWRINTIGTNMCCSRVAWGNGDREAIEVIHIIREGPTDHRYRRTQSIQLKPDMDLDVVSRVNPWDFHFHAGEFCFQSHGKRE